MTFPRYRSHRRLDRDGLIVTAPGDGGYDFVSRYFAPAQGYPGRSRDRRGALHAHALLGQATQQER